MSFTYCRCGQFSRYLSCVLDLSFSDGLAEAIDSGTVNFEMLFYEDECNIPLRVLPKKGRVRKGRPLFGRTPYIAMKPSVLAVISSKSWIKVDVINGSVTDTEFKRFCLEEQDPDELAPNLGGPALQRLLPSDSFLIWDRLGRSGRKVQPSKLHYNPEIHEKLQEKNIMVKMLPPKGHDLNPVELFNNVLKSRVRKFEPSPTVEDEYGRKVKGPQSFQDCRKAVSMALELMRNEPDMFQKFYENRCMGKDLERRAERSKPARAAKKEREEVLINAKFILEE